MAELLCNPDNVATSSVPSRRPKGGQNCYVTLVFSWVANAKRRDQIRIGCLTRAFSRAQKMAEWLCNPDIFGGPQRQARGQNQMWLPHPNLLQGPKEGGIAATLVFSRVADAKRGDKIRIGCLTAAFWGPERGWNCWVTHAFSGVPKAKRGDKIRCGFITGAFSGAQKRAELLRNPCSDKRGDKM